MIFDNNDTPEARAEPARRLRVGVTGLVAVVLVIVLATAIATGVGRRAESEAAAVAVTENRVVVSPAVNSTAPSEPLADLGLTPRAEDDGHGDGGAEAAGGAHGAIQQNAQQPVAPAP